MSDEAAGDRWKPEVSMCRESDRRYAEMLLSMGRADVERLAHDTARPRRSVAMWVAHQLAEQSRRLDIPPTLAESMRHTARTIREKSGRLAMHGR